MGYTVYIHTSPSGKKYVGITGRNALARWANGKGYKSCTLFNRAIEKYGWENIEHEVIATGLTEDEAKAMEQELILKYQTNNNRYGYNLTTGGEHYLHSETTKENMSKTAKKNYQSEEHRAKMSAALTGRKLPPLSEKRKQEIGEWSKNLKRKPLTDEQKKKISEATKAAMQKPEVRKNFEMAMKKRYPNPKRKQSKEHSQKISWNKGVPLSEEHKEKLSKAHKGKVLSEETKVKMSLSNKKSKPIRLYSENGVLLQEFHSINEASKRTGIPYKTIIYRCKHKKMVNGQYWELIINNI